MRLSEFMKSERVSLSLAMFPGAADIPSSGNTLGASCRPCIDGGDKNLIFVVVGSRVSTGLRRFSLARRLLDQLADNGEQFAKIDFGNDYVNVLSHTIGDVIGYAREENDWEFWFGSSNCLSHKIAIHSWHLVIQHDKIHRVLKQ